MSNIILGVIIGLLIAILVVISNRRYNISDKTTQKIDTVFTPKAKIIQAQTELEKEIDNLLKNE